MKRIHVLLLFVLLLLPVKAQISVSPHAFPLKEVANAVIDNPSLAELFVPQIIDALVERPEEIAPLGISLLSDPLFMKRVLEALPGLLYLLPMILPRLPRVLQNLPYFMEAMLPNADALINSLVYVINENPQTISDALNSLIPVVVENMDVLIEVFSASLSVVLGYAPQLVEIAVRLTPILPEVVARIDLEGLSGLLLLYLPQISDSLVSLSSGLSQEQILKISELTLYFLRALPRVLPDVVSAALILLLSPRSVFSVLFSLITSVSPRDLPGIILSLLRICVASLRVALVCLSEENVRILCRTAVSAAGSFDLPSLLASLQESNVEIDGALVPRWVVS